VAAVAATGLISVACAAGKFGDLTSPTAVGGGSTQPVVTIPSGTPLAYTQDIKPILDADCVRCHGTRSPSAGIDVSSYTAVMRIVTPGSASSRLVTSTGSGGKMYSQLSGSRATKSATIRAWVLAGATQNR
jgi:hypothetical protein